MQIKSLHANIYKLYSYSRTQECLDAYRIKYQDTVIKWQKLKKEGVSDKLAQEIVGVSRSSYFRAQALLKDLEKGILPPSKRPKKSRQPTWGKLESDLILKIRKENPTYGKQKIEVILKRDHACFLSQSTVGRILNHLKEKGLIQRSPSALKVKRKRNFDQRHAKPWSFKLYKNMQMGERVQIDHMTVTKNGICLKHFQAWDRRSKFVWGQVYSKANSSCAKKFLQEFIKNCPFKIHSIQVDGGSEFMADFKQECARLHIPLIVLPPCKPQ